MRSKQFLIGAGLHRNEFGDCELLYKPNSSLLREQEVQKLFPVVPVLLLPVTAIKHHGTLERNEHSVQESRPKQSPHRSE